VAGTVYYKSELWYHAPMKRRKVEVQWLYKSPARLAAEAAAQAKRQSKIAKSKISRPKQKLSESVKGLQAAKDAKSAEGASSDSPAVNGSKAKKESKAQSLSDAQNAPALAKAAKQFPRLAPRSLSELVPRHVRARIWKPIVLEALKVMPNFSTAAKRAGISYQAIQQYCKAHSDFKQQCAEACEQGVQALQLVAAKPHPHRVVNPVDGRWNDLTVHRDIVGRGQHRVWATSDFKSVGEQHRKLFRVKHDSFVRHDHIDFVSLAVFVEELHFSHRFEPATLRALVCHQRLRIGRH